jgi:Zn-finger nucleic acid-binding protein
MRCPRDPSQELVKLIGDAEAYTCDRCGGMFFTKGELDRLAEPHEGSLEYSSVDLDSFSHPDRFGPASCPADGTAMKKVSFNIHTDIILDYCPTCGGFWLDQGELERINSEVRHLVQADTEVPDPPMMWFAKALWSLSR